MVIGLSVISKKFSFALSTDYFGNIFKNQHWTELLLDTGTNASAVGNGYPVGTVSSRAENCSLSWPGLGSPGNKYAGSLLAPSGQLLVSPLTHIGQEPEGTEVLDAAPRFRARWKG